MSLVNYGFLGEDLDLHWLTVEKVDISNRWPTVNSQFFQHWPNDFASFSYIFNQYFKRPFQIFSLENQNAKNNFQVMHSSFNMA